MTALVLHFSESGKIGLIYLQIYALCGRPFSLGASILVGGLVLPFWHPRVEIWTRGVPKCKFSYGKRCNKQLFTEIVSINSGVGFWHLLETLGAVFPYFCCPGDRLDNGMSFGVASDPKFMGGEANLRGILRL